MAVCNYFKKKEGKVLCTFSKELEVDCNGLEQNICEWYTLAGLLQSLDSKKTYVYYNAWIRKIAGELAKEEIEAHIAKHLKEDVKNYSNWIASADNLLDIRSNVEGIIGESEQTLLLKCKVGEYRKNNVIPIKVKLGRLINYYRKHTEKATVPPLTPEELNKFLK